jgi:hypothetical protein
VKYDLKKLVAKTKITPSDLANEVLYELCQQYPRHDDPGAIYAKILLIGRSHAAAIERRDKDLEIPNDEFYERKVVPGIQRSSLDEWIDQAAATPGVTAESLHVLLSVHSKLTRLFARLTDREQRSLASKYLHFHLPEHFFLYDTRAVRALGFLKGVIGKRFVVPKNARYDIEYERLVRKCLKLRIEALKLGIAPLTPRSVDNLLLRVYADEMKRRLRQSKKRAK